VLAHSAFRKFARLSTALGAAAAVNGLLLGALLLLNRSPQPERDEVEQAAPVRFVTNVTAESEPTPDQSQNRDRPEPTQSDPTPAKLNTPRPTPAQATPQPVAANLELSSVPQSPLKLPMASVATAAVAAQSKQAPQGENQSPAQDNPGPDQAREADQGPEKIAGARPSYPEAALHRAIEGHVLVKLLINKRGRVETVEVLQVEGPQSFADEVTRTVKGWRFKPARHEGKPVRVWARKRIRFQISD